MTRREGFGAAWRSAAVGVAMGVGAAPALAQNDDAPGNDAQAHDAPASQSPEGIVPVPEYAGEWRERGYLLGEWGGVRGSLAQGGLTYDLNWTQSVQGVVSGGTNSAWEYGGNLDLLMQADLMRMGIMPGAVVRVRAESRYGDSVNGGTGAILPVNTTAFFPLTDELNESIPITITELNYTQYLATWLGVQAGKIQTLDGDLTEFASGRGRSQFMNANFVFNSALALTMPYSTLGAVVIVLPTDRIVLTSGLMLTTDSSTTTGFDDFGDGTSWASQATFQYSLGSLPGGQNVGFVYSFEDEFLNFNSLALLPTGPAIGVEDDTWSVYWSAWQYLWTDGELGVPVNLMDGVPDVRGFGLFARVGVADDDTNPVSWSVSGGLGGRGLLASRPDDTYGVGAYHTAVEETKVFTLLDVASATSGFEAFYNVQVLGSVNLTFDVQVVEPARETVDTAVAVGARLNIRF